MLTLFLYISALDRKIVLLQDFQPLCAIATTSIGADRLRSICQPNNPVWVPRSLSSIAGVQAYSGSLKSHVAELWQSHRAFVFCLATGAVVRIVAPLLQSKATDPAVVVVDEAGKFVVSLCGGHQGGADRLTKIIAQLIDATPILTSASTSLGLPAVDLLGVPFGWHKGKGDWTEVSAAVVRGEPVQVIQEAGSTLWRSTASVRRSHLSFTPSPDATAEIWITPRLIQDARSRTPQIQWHPRVLWVGIGCERGTSRQLIEAALQQVCRENQLAAEAIAGIATIDLKADEVGLVELCHAYDFPLRTFPAEILSAISVPNPSPVVEREVGTPSVAEAAALCACLDLPETKHHTDSDRNVTPKLLVSKQIFKPNTPTPDSSTGAQPCAPTTPDLTGAVTIAIAQSEIEYTGRIGKLFLVGIGPGAIEQITPAAKSAIATADAVIGYSLYIELIAALLQPQQVIETLPITQERQRAQRAIELAQWGLTVAVVSSGDCGIYGMAGLVMEELQAGDWDGNTPQVQVFPGITALQAAAARVGTPLMHDFCAISLSDLLTPWQVIEKRLIAAAMADFVTAIYNPRSQSRVQQLQIARDIFLQYRAPNTPVAIVRAAYRQDEQIYLTTLEKLLDLPVDMLSTVLIGNSSTRTYANWIITPRGYLGFVPEMKE
ncbi:precorrin-3B C(17)-methyltransferase [Chroococcidiopsis thermalis]|uniref:Precorrin-3 methyltransferase n=1 Tax=Chroococcidiopsis thermalis (strain PCC 7203) TaxID=251229 RepID=K9TUC1_CHRTP|nr:precorrin-3B C(17)-methyltransferase [Chroococcidiopsis thermalis]AFY86003.1 precorrin-3 methyltransferase [Chroococcidiopsis thermalis PCC 7203]